MGRGFCSFAVGARMQPKGVEGEVSTVEVEDELECLPDEELLRLDDGPPLPSELTEFRTLLQMQTALIAEAAADKEPGGSPISAFRMKKMEQIRDCLDEFDDSVIFLHDRLLDHERMCRSFSQSHPILPSPER